jgi:hypothetical protein
MSRRGTGNIYMKYLERFYGLLLPIWKTFTARNMFISFILIPACSSPYFKLKYYYNYKRQRWSCAYLIKHYAKKEYGEWIFRSKFSWPRHYLEVSGQFQVSAVLLLEKEPPVSVGYEFRWTPEPVSTIWESENSSPCRDSSSDPSIVQPIGSPYTDYATVALYHHNYNNY